MIKAKRMNFNLLAVASSKSSGANVFNIVDLIDNGNPNDVEVMMDENVELNRTIVNIFQREYRNKDRIIDFLHEKLLKEEQERLNLADRYFESLRILRLEKDDIIKEKNDLLKEKDLFIKGKDDIIKEKDMIIREKDEIIKEKDYLYRDIVTLEREKYNLIRDNECLASEKSDLLDKIENLKRQVHDCNQVIFSNDLQMNELERKHDIEIWRIKNEKLTLEENLKDFREEYELKLMGLVEENRELKENCDIMVSQYNIEISKINKEHKIYEEQKNKQLLFYSQELDRIKKQLDNDLAVVRERNGGKLQVLKEKNKVLAEILHNERYEMNLLFQNALEVIKLLQSQIELTSSN